MLYDQMQLSKYVPSLPNAHVKNVISSMIIMRYHRRIKITRVGFPKEDKSLATQFCPQQKQQQVERRREEKRRGDDELVRCSSRVQGALKRKIIGKLAQNQQKAKRMLFKKYLTNFLHRTNMMEARRNIQPLVSVLDTQDDGDYLEDMDKKEHPHYSNIMNPVHIDIHYSPRLYIKFINDCMPQLRITTSIEDRCILKHRVVYQLLKSIYRFNSLSNYDFDFMLPEINYRTAKLFYDIINDHYEIQKELEKKFDCKNKAETSILSNLNAAINTYIHHHQLNTSAYIPNQQIWLSLKDIRLAIRDQNFEKSQQLSD